MSIVQINISQTVAPTPSRLQGTGALISQGGTTTAQGTRTLLTSASALTAILKGSLPLSSLAWATNVVTATTVSPHGFTNGDTLQLTISGAVPSLYNGTYTCTVTGATTFTYPLLSNPGAETTPGVYTPEDVAELQAMVTNFFAMGSQLGVYVLELGPGNATDGATYLTTWIAANPGVFYAYVVPRFWDANSTFLSLLATFEAASSKTYFFVTSTSGTYTAYTAAMKCAVVNVEATGIPATEFDAAANAFVVLNYNPSSTNKVTPTSFSFLFGVTAYPTANNGALLAALAAANVNVVGTGAEGGISNNILLYGTTKDGNDFTYWYSVDWVQINLDLNVSNAVINGSNNPLAPLYYNQDGINTLQAVAASTMNTAVADGLSLGQVLQTQLDPTTFAVNLAAGVYNGLTVVNAVPFTTYTHLNPTDFAVGRYGGLSVAYTPNRGFKTIVININVTQFAAP